MSDLKLVENMVYNMDQELHTNLHQQACLKDSGLHEDDLDTTGLIRGTVNGATAVPIAYSVDFIKFENTARDKWALIYSRHQAVTAQVSAQSK